MVFTLTLHCVQHPWGVRGVGLKVGDTVLVQLPNSHRGGYGSSGGNHYTTSIEQHYYGHNYEEIASKLQLAILKVIIQVMCLTIATGYS